MHCAHAFVIQYMVLHKTLHADLLAWRPTVQFISKSVLHTYERVQEDDLLLILVNASDCLCLSNIYTKQCV